MPVSCCAYRTQLVQVNQCQSNLVNAYRKGCYDILMIWLDRYGSLIGSISMVMAFFHFICFILGFKFCRLIDKERKANLKERKRHQHVYDTTTLTDQVSNNDY